MTFRATQRRDIYENVKIAGLAGAPARPRRRIKAGTTGVNKRNRS